MKKLNRLLPVATLASLAVIISPANAAITITLSDIAGGGTLNVVCGPTAGNSATCSGADANYTVVLTNAIDNTGSAGAAHQGSTLNITAAAGSTTDPLVVTILSTGFLAPTGSAAVVESLTANNPVAGTFGTITGTGTVTGAGSSGSTGTATVACTALGVGAGCGTTPPSTGAWLGTSSSTGAATLATPFNLTEVMTVSITVPGQANFTADIDTISTAVPEPMSISLLGGILLMTTGAIRRKRRQASRV